MPKFQLLKCVILHKILVVFDLEERNFLDKQLSHIFDLVMVVNGSLTVWDVHHQLHILHHVLEYIAGGLNLLPQVLLSAHLHRFPELVPLAVFIRQVLKCILYHLVGYLDLGRPGDRLVRQLLLNLLKVLDDTLLVLNFLLQLKVQSFVLLLRLLCLVFVFKNLLRMLL